MQSKESEWVKSEFSAYFDPLKISIKNKILLNQVSLAQEIHAPSGITYAVLFSEFWTYKKEMSDALIIVGIKDHTVISAAFTKLIYTNSSSCITTSDWISVAEPGVGYGSEIKHIRDQLLQRISDYLQKQIFYTVNDRNNTQLQKSDLDEEQKEIQRIKWNKLFKNTVAVFTPLHTTPSTNTSITAFLWEQAEHHPHTLDLETFLKLVSE